jgi:hypothetical protein
MKKNKAAQILGRLGGQARTKALSKAERTEIAQKGANARASKLSAARRSEIAKKAVQARIKKYNQQTIKEKTA